MLKVTKLTKIALKPCRKKIAAVAAAAAAANLAVDGPRQVWLATDSLLEKKS